MININITNDQISGSVNGEPFSVEYSEERYNDMVALQQKEQQAESLEDAQEIWEEFEELTTISPKEQIETESQYLTYNPAKDTYHLKHNDKVSPIPVPQSLVDKLLYAVDKNLPVDPLVKFFIRTLRNPNIVEGDIDEATAFAQRLCDYVTKTFVSPNLLEEYKEQGMSDEVAREMATVPQTPITMEGLILTKKVVTPLWDKMKYKYELDENGEKQKVLRDGYEKVIDEETGEVSIEGPDDVFAEDMVFQPYVMGKRGDAFRCGEEDDAPLGHVIRVGKEMRLDNWDQVNCNPLASCVPGIHTGNQDYINGYEHSDNCTLEMQTDPMYVGAVSCGEDVLRVKQAKPYGVKDRDVDNANLYHSSKYAALNDARWDEYCKEVVERFQEEKEEKISDAEEEFENRMDRIPN